MPQEEHKQLIVIILHGNIKDFVYAQGVFRQVSALFPEEETALLTVPALKDVAEASGYFNYVWVDPLYKFFQITELKAFRQRFLNMDIKLVIDLHNSPRTKYYHHLLGRKRPLWSSYLTNCKLPYIPEFITTPQGTTEEHHVLHHHMRQLQNLGITDIIQEDIQPDTSWLEADISKFLPEDNFIILAPTPPNNKVEDGWNIEQWANLVEHVEVEFGIKSILAGEFGDAYYGKELSSRCVKSSPINLIGKLSYSQIAQLSRQAIISIGNDQPIVYLMAYSGCPSIFLYSATANLKLWIPNLPHIRGIQRQNIEKLGLNTVLDVINDLIAQDEEIDEEVEIFTPEE